MKQIAVINNQLQNNGRTDASTASLLDQRDQYIDQLSQLMDIRVVTNNLEPGDACSPIPACSWSAPRRRSWRSIRRAR